MGIGSIEFSCLRVLNDMFTLLLDLSSATSTGDFDYLGSNPCFGPLGGSGNFKKARRASGV